MMLVFQAPQLPVGLALCVYVADAMAAVPAVNLAVAYVAACTLVSALVQGFQLLSLSRLYRRLEDRMAAGEVLSPAVAADWRRALTPYWRLSVAALVAWWVPVVGFPALMSASGTEFPGRSMALSMLAGTTIGAAQAVVAFYVMYLLVAREVAPVLLRDGSLEPLAPFRPIYMWVHVAVVTLMLGVVLPLGSVALYTLAPGWVAVAAAALMMVLTGTVQSLGIMSSISRPVGNLLENMQAVRAGRLDVKATIRNLDTLGVLASHFNRMVEGLRQREFLRDTFGRYVAREVADHILAGRVELGGETRTATVLFSDIRGFTRMSEGMTPAEVVAFLNAYLGLMVGCVTEHHGMLDKFIGDAVMAVFGVPVSTGTPESDARAAVACALEMERRLGTFNAERRAAGQAEIDIGVGIHSGELVAGNIGSAERMQYTVIGDTVNLASRLEGMTKGLGRRIVVSESTAALVKDAFVLEELETLPVRGRAAGVKVYAVTAGARA